jgi:cell fate regulator YaaT (PSP1 superfamily)
MSIFPLPIFERDEDPAHRDAMTDAEIYARLKAPTSIVVKFGSIKLIGEYPYDGSAKPGCGSRLVVKTHRGTEVAEMLTTTCPNSGCSKSISRREMLEYVENSGGKEYPFHTNGRVLRVATIEDLNAWSARRERFGREELDAVRAEAKSMGFTMKIVEVEPVLGGEHVTVHYLSEERVDFRELVPALARRFGARVEMHQIGARDEARLTADYEKCGQHCCCKNFLKVLKPVSMRSAKTQKASLDPLKISGRCGRLMCCLRYEDETYEELKKRLPKNKSRVGTTEGPGTVIDSKILVQLVLVRLDHNGEDIAVPVEELLPVDACPQPAAQPDPFRGMGRRDVARRTGAQGRTNDGRGSKDAQQQGFKDASKAADAQPKARTEGERAPQASGSAGASASPGTPASPKAPGAAASGDATPGAPGAPGSGKKRRRRGRGGKGRGSGNGGTPGNTAPNTDLHSPREADGNDAGGTDSDADD